MLTVVDGKSPSLLGRNWLKYLRLDRIAKVEPKSKLYKLLTKYKELFKEELGTVCKYKASVHIKEGACPKFFGLHSVPFAIQGAVKIELDRLEAAEILEKVCYSDLAALIVAVHKKDGKFCICGDYKATINPVLDTEQHPLPRPD